MALLQRILDQTSGLTAVQAANAASTNKPPIILGSTDRLRTPNTVLGQPVLIPSATQPSFTKVLPFRTRIGNGFRSIGQTMLQPRLAMTAAMAFFSIALTLNLTGIRLTDLRASDFRPSSIMRSASQAKTRVVQYTDNLRVVYELESRVRRPATLLGREWIQHHRGPPERPRFRPATRRSEPKARQPEAGPEAD